MEYKNSKTIKNYKDVIFTDPELNEEYEFPDFYIGEQVVEYPFYDIGDIVYVKNYKYSNNENGKNHLFVIVDIDNYAVPIDNFCMLISSNLSKLKFKSNIYLEKNKRNNLKNNSIVKTDEIYKIKTKEISFKIGEIEKSVVSKYKEIYLKGERYEK